jgi:hypothetical protein
VLEPAFLAGGAIVGPGRARAVRPGTGEITEWLLFPRDGVTTRAADAVGRAERLSDLREDNRSRIRGTSGQAPDVIDLLFANPT